MPVWRAAGGEHTPDRPPKHLEQRQHDLWLARRHIVDQGLRGPHDPHTVQWGSWSITRAVVGGVSRMGARGAEAEGRAVYSSAARAWSSRASLEGGVN